MDRCPDNLFVQLMTDALKRIGLVLRRLRGERGLSQEAMAELAGINRNFYGRLERGDSDFSITTLGKLSVALGVPASAILKEAENA